MTHQPDMDLFSENTMIKAKKFEDVYQDDRHKDVWWAKDGRYRVELGDGWTSCSCPHGMNHSPAVCYHVAAAALKLEEQGTSEDHEDVHFELPNGDGSLPDQPAVMKRRKTRQLPAKRGKAKAPATSEELDKKLEQVQDTPIEQVEEELANAKRDKDDEMAALATEFPDKHNLAGYQKGEDDDGGLE